MGGESGIRWSGARSVVGGSGAGVLRHSGTICQLRCYGVGPQDPSHLGIQGCTASRDSQAEAQEQARKLRSA